MYIYKYICIDIYSFVCVRMCVKRRRTNLQSQLHSEFTWSSYNTHGTSVSF